MLVCSSYINGGTVHRCHGSIRFRFNSGDKQIYYARFLFIYFEQTLEQIKKFHLDICTLCFIYIIYTYTQVINS